MFYPPEMLEQARRHPELGKWCSKQAAPWLALDDDDLWDLVFGNTITRSWMVWSDGHCPACRRAVNMYAWKIDPFAQPWKLRCPHCDELFPKNDFSAFYRSGLDERGVFDPAKADRELLVWDTAPSPDGAERSPSFGIDDGEGYVEGDGRWRFVGTYLVYGLWKGQIVAGIERLAAAYTTTGDPACARKAGILLDRVSDLYPSFDYAREGLVYERPGKRGYVSNWHDACNEVLTLCLAYDQLREALSRDQELSRFLSRKSDEFDLPTPKSSALQICRNIEERIFWDTLENVHKIESNFPTTDMAGIVIHAVLDGDDGLEDVHSRLQEVLHRATRVDGVSGEKGVGGYSAIAPKTLAKYLALFARADNTFLPAAMARTPLPVPRSRQAEPTIGTSSIASRTS